MVHVPLRGSAEAALQHDRAADADLVQLLLTASY
jgi:hypothetical protein